MRYTKFFANIWSTKLFKQIAQIPEPHKSNCLQVYFYLNANPQSNMLGLYKLSLDVLDKGAQINNPEHTRLALTALEKLGFCKYDDETAFVWIVDYLREQTGASLSKNDNRAVSVQNIYDELADNPFLGQFYDLYAGGYHIEIKREYAPEQVEIPQEVRDLFGMDFAWTGKNEGASEASRSSSSNSYKTEIVNSSRGECEGGMQKSLFDEVDPFGDPVDDDDHFGNPVDDFDNPEPDQPTVEPVRLGSAPDGTPKQRDDSENKAPKPKSDRGTRLGEDWVLPDEWAQWVRDNFPEVNYILEADKFKDYWLSKTGAGATKRNWQAVWRNWIRNAKSYSSGNVVKMHNGMHWRDTLPVGHPERRVVL